MADDSIKPIVELEVVETKTGEDETCVSYRGCFVRVRRRQGKGISLDGARSRRRSPQPRQKQV